MIFLPKTCLLHAYLKGTLRLVYSDICNVDCTNSASAAPLRWATHSCLFDQPAGTAWIHAFCMEHWRQILFVSSKPVFPIRASPVVYQGTVRMALPLLTRFNLAMFATDHSQYTGSEKICAAKMAKYLHKNTICHFSWLRVVFLWQWSSLNVVH